MGSLAKLSRFLQLGLLCTTLLVQSLVCNFNWCSQQIIGALNANTASQMQEQMPPCHAALTEHASDPSTPASSSPEPEDAELCRQLDMLAQGQQEQAPQLKSVVLALPDWFQVQSQQIAIHPEVPAELLAKILPQSPIPPLQRKQSYLI